MRHELDLPAHHRLATQPVKILLAISRELSILPSGEERVKALALLDVDDLFAFPDDDSQSGVVRHVNTIPKMRPSCNGGVISQAPRPSRIINSPEW